MLPGRLRGVLERHGHVQRAVAHPGDEVRRAALADADVELGGLEQERRHGGGDDRGERAGERADPEPVALLRDELRELRVGERQALRDRPRVDEEPLAGRREAQPAPPSLDQAGPELALERGDLLGDGGLGERQRVGGARERAVLGDRAEREQPPRIQHQLSLSPR